MGQQPNVIANELPAATERALRGLWLEGDTVTVNQVINPRGKLFAHMDTLAAIRRGERPAPISVEFFVSNRCGHGCSWCHYAYTHTRGPLAGKMERPDGAISSGDLVDLQLATRIFAELKAAGVKAVVFSGGGEPTQHPHFDEIITSAVEHGLEVGLYTHGSNISVERATLLKRLATWVYVSLDECTAEAFKENKGVNRFDKVLEGITNLVKAEGKATIGVGFLLRKENWRDVHKMVNLAESLCVDHVQFRPTIRYRQDAPNQLNEDTNWVTLALGHLGVYQNDPFVIADLERFKAYRDWQGHTYKTCFWSALQVAISPNGKVWRCTNKTEHPDALLGDLSIEPFAEIWARSGGACTVDGKCRVMCIGNAKNPSLAAMMTPQPHANFP